MAERWPDFDQILAENWPEIDREKPQKRGILLTSKSSKKKQATFFRRNDFEIETGDFRK